MPGSRREVGDERGLAGRHGHDAGPAAAHAPPEPAATRHELRRLEQLVEVVAADDARGPQGGIGCPVLARERARVGDRRGLRLRTAANLDDHDRLAELQRVIGQGEEPLRPLEALHEQDDRVGLRVVEAVGEEVAGVEDDLAAAADDPREADPRPGVDERVRHRTRLGDARHAAPRQPRIDVADVRRRVRREVDHAHAVRAEQGDPVADRDLADVALHLRRRLAALDDAAAGDDHARDAGEGGLLGDGGRPERVERDEDRVRDLGQRVERWVARLVVELVVARVDEVAAGRALHDGQVVLDGLGDATPRRRADDGDGARSEERPEVDRPRRRRGDGRAPRSPCARVGAHPTTLDTPRFSIARATISRWISEVPSQIRSTRSSRKKRSAGYSRM